MSVAPFRLVLATANPDKAAEVAAILGERSGVELLSRPEGMGEVEETGDTLLENARLKAKAVATVAGLPAVADDTGLEVDALGGQPGVRSSRFAGETATYADNVAKLLAELSALPDHGGERRARFRTVALVSFPDGTEVWAEGVVEGAIAEAPRGAGGFGYDPVFVPGGGGGRTFAEMDPSQKHRLSHRGRALRALAVRLASQTAHP